MVDNSQGTLRIPQRSKIGSPWAFKDGFKEQGSLVSLEESKNQAGPQHIPYLLVAEDFAVVENLNLQHFISVNSAGHWPPERLGREGQL